MLEGHFAVTEIERLARRSVQIAVDWLNKQGISLKKQPTLLYCPKLYPLDIVSSGKTYASVKTEENNVIANLANAQYFEFEAMYERFGLKLSKKVSDYFYNACAKVARKISKASYKAMGQQPADITLYSPIKERIKDLDELIVHETWHLVENEARIKDEDIGEGTATYVQCKFADRRPNFSHPQDEYESTAQIIGSILDEKFNYDVPLSVLLEPKIREELYRAVDVVCGRIKYAREKARKKVESPEYIEFQRQAILNHPAWLSFRKNPAPQTYLEGLVLIGDKIIAQELKGQDLTRLVKYGADLIGKSNQRTLQK